MLSPPASSAVPHATFERVSNTPLLLQTPAKLHEVELIRQWERYCAAVNISPSAIRKHLDSLIRSRIRGLVKNVCITVNNYPLAVRRDLLSSCQFIEGVGSSRWVRL